MITAYTDWTTAYVKKVRYYLRDFYIDYGHLVYTLYPLVDFDNMKTITNDIESAFLVSTEIARDSKGVCNIKCKFESPSEFLNFKHNIHVEYVGRVFSDFENPRKYIEFQVPTPSIRHYIDTDIAEIKQMINDRYGIANAKIKDYFPGYKYEHKHDDHVDATYYAVSSEGYSPIRWLPDFPNCVWPKQTFEQTETKTLKAVDVITFDYKVDDSTIYPNVDIINEMWNRCVKRYTDDPLPTGVAIVKEEKDMSHYEYKPTTEKKKDLKLYMVEDKPIYTQRGMVRGTAHKVEELPEAIRNVQFNEKKGVVTVVWTDGVVTMAKCGSNDIWDPEKGLAIAIMKRWFKSTTSMNKWIKKTVPEDPDPIPFFQGLVREAFKEAVESDRAEMLEKYESVKEG